VTSGHHPGPIHVGLVRIGNRRAFAKLDHPPGEASPTRPCYRPERELLVKDDGDQYFQITRGRGFDLSGLVERVMSRVGGPAQGRGVIDPLRVLSIELLEHLRRSLGSDVSYREPLEPLRGGFVTDVYSFALDCGAPGWNRPLVLRLYPGDAEAVGIRRESCAQEVVSAQGAPAPRVLACEATAGALWRPFMIMEKLPGRPQMVIEFPASCSKYRACSPCRDVMPRRWKWSMRWMRRPSCVHSRRRESTDEPPAPRIGSTRPRPTIARWSLDGLRPALEWLGSHRPAEPRRLAICHGDLFGANILEERGRVTGILDWNLVTVADSAFDLGGQIAAYEMSAVPGPRALQLVSVGFGRLLRERTSSRVPASPGAGRGRDPLLRRDASVHGADLQARSRSRSPSHRRRAPNAYVASGDCARYFERLTGVRIATGTT
jgi:hypothetical protein